MKDINIFISYSWDSEEHKLWVMKLANSLEEHYGLHVVLDQYDLDSFSDKNHFMENGVFNSDVIIVVVTEGYVEKANNRRRGVGIETKMTSSRHWEESIENGESKIIPVLRDGTVLPNYLSEKIYIDFTDDDSFEESFSRLKSHLAGDSKKRRPEKKLILSEKPVHKDLTRIEDFLKINYKKRRLVFDKKESINYSGPNRIKFELWETKSPSIDYYLFLFDGVTISQTIARVCELLHRDALKINRLNVLRTTEGKKDNIKKLFASHNCNFEIVELTYSDYIWDFCIDDAAKDDSEVYQNPFFIDQTLVEFDDPSNELGAASQYIKRILDDPENSFANIIIAPGGTGKTTLCQNLTNHYQKTGKTISILIQSEELKSDDVKLVYENIRIESVYDLYETYIKICGKSADKGFIFDQITFEVAILTGRLVLIIDGVDEFISIFPEGFDLNKFVDSINDLSKQMGLAKIIITSRNDVFDEALMSLYDGLSKYKLLGFDGALCQKYLEKRFKRSQEKERIIKKVWSNIDLLINKDINRRVFPFVVDLFSSAIGSSLDAEDGKLDFSLSAKNYSCNKTIIDYLVYSILRRELIRQTINVSIDDLINVFMEMVSANKESFNKDDIKEIISITCADNIESLLPKFLRNPLLDVKGSNCRFKYDFLNDYFKSLYLIDAIEKKIVTDDFVKMIARHAYGNGDVFKDVLKYFFDKESSLITLILEIVNKIKGRISFDDVHSNNDTNFRAIGFLVKLVANMQTSKISKEHFSSNIKSIFNGGGVITNLAIYGGDSPLDFTGLRINSSRFVKYDGFLSSRFGDSKFTNCFFDLNKNVNISESFDPEMFVDCRLGDLAYIIDDVKRNTKNNRILIEAEFIRFLRSFFSGGRFKDQKLLYVKMSDKVHEINKAFFEELVKRGFLTLKTEKPDEDYYEIGGLYRHSVYGFMTSNKVDKNIEDIINILL